MFWCVLNQDFQRNVLWFSYREKGGIISTGKNNMRTEESCDPSSTLIIQFWYWKKGVIYLQWAGKRSYGWNKFSFTRYPNELFCQKVSGLLFQLKWYDPDLQVQPCPESFWREFIGVPIPLARHSRYQISNRYHKLLL